MRNDFTLLDMFKEIPPRIVDGDSYYFDCYGTNARYLDLESNLSLIFDEKTFIIYEASLPEDHLIWRHRNYEDAFIEEIKTRRGADDSVVDSRSANVSSIHDIIRIIKKRYEEYDKLKEEKNAKLFKKNWNL